MSAFQSWFADLPADWSVMKLSSLFQQISSGTTPQTGIARYYDGDIPWVTTSELRENVIFETTKNITTEALLEHSALTIYSPGTLLIAMYGATIGRIGILGISATTNQACCALANPKDILTQFAYYVLIAAKPYILGLASGGGQPNVNQEIIRNLRVPTPPVWRQRAIANFLDRETAKTNALIAQVAGSDWREVVDVKQVGGMIGLLLQRRIALITAAVTGQIDTTEPALAEAVA